MTLTLWAATLALLIGTAVAACRVSPVGPLRAAGAVWTEVMRNTPLTVLMVLFYFGFPKMGIRYPGFASAVIVLGAYTSAFVAEALRSGVNAVPVGQAEAARALGLTFPQVLGQLVLPQAFRTVVAPLGNLFIALTKNSSIASVIAVVELTRVAEDVTTATAQAIPAYLGTAVAYLILTLPSGLLFGVIERRVAVKR